MIYLMNSAVMPTACYGVWRYRPATAADLSAVVRGERGPWVSTIGYPQTADLIHRLTGVRVPVARVTVQFTPGDWAMVVRLRDRVKEPWMKGLPMPGLDDPRAWEFATVEFLSEWVEESD